VKIFVNNVTGIFYFQKMFKLFRKRLTYNVFRNSVVLRYSDLHFLHLASFEAPKNFSSIVNNLDLGKNTYCMKLLIRRPLCGFILIHRIA
jgi:hypothetical protein